MDNIQKTKDTSSIAENYNFSHRVNGMNRALNNLRQSSSDQKKIYAIYEIAQYCGLAYENQEFTQMGMPNQIAILHTFFLQQFTPTLQFHQNPNNSLSVWVLKTEFTNRNTQLNVFDIFHGPLTQQTDKLNNFIARIIDLIREVPNEIITIGLREKQEQHKNIDIALDVYKALDPEEQDIKLLQNIMMRIKERENNIEWPGLYAVADLIIINKKLSILLSHYTAENTTIEDIYDLLKQ